MFKSQCEEIRFHLAMLLGDGKPHTTAECNEYIRHKTGRDVRANTIQYAMRSLGNRKYNRDVRGTIQRIGSVPTDSLALSQWLEEHIMDAADEFNMKLRDICTFNLMQVPTDEYEELTLICEKARTFLDSVNVDIQDFCSALQREDPSEDEVP